MLPQEFLERMENMLGEEYPAFLKSYDIARYQALRLNPQKGDDVSFLNRGGFSLERVPWAEHGYYYTAKDTPGKHPYHEAGVYYIQEPSAMAPAAYLTRQMADGAGERILDLCAAPGGKALHAAQILNGTGMVEARDLTEMKVELIRENISRMGFENIRAVQQDATCFDADSEEKADVLIADLPCSGLGVLAKKTDLKYKMNPETETEVAALQREILDAVCRYVKPEGTLMYSTCTISRTENEENAGWFAEKHPEFDLEWEKQIFPSDITDGFYIAKFIRRGR